MIRTTLNPLVRKLHPALLKLVSAILLVNVLSACEFPRGRVVEVSVHDGAVSDPVSILDYGYEVTAIVENLGTEKARFAVEATLSCTEGQWVMTRDLVLDGRKKLPVKFFFKQPTIEAKDVRSIVTVGPKF